MRSPPLIALLCIISLLCTILVGCASTTQTMQPPGSAVTLNIGSPDNPAELHGVTVVAIGCQVGYTAKPVGLDVLNPAVSAAAQNNSGTSNSNATAGPVEQTKPSGLPENSPDLDTAKKATAPATEGLAKAPSEQGADQAVKTAGDTKKAEDTTAAPSGGE